MCYDWWSYNKCLRLYYLNKRYDIVDWFFIFQRADGKINCTDSPHGLFVSSLEHYHLMIMIIFISVIVICLHMLGSQDWQCVIGYWWRLPLDLFASISGRSCKIDYPIISNNYWGDVELICPWVEQVSIARLWPLIYPSTTTFRWAQNRILGSWRNTTLTTSQMDDHPVSY